MAKTMQPCATDVLAELEALALRDLGHQTERLRAALARAAPSRADAVEHGELSRARLGASDALDLYVRVHDAGRAARAEAQEDEMEAQLKPWDMEIQVKPWQGDDGAGQTPTVQEWQQGADRGRFKHDG